MSEPTPLWVHSRRAEDGSAFFEVLSEDHAGRPLAIGGICDDFDAIAILVRAGVPSITAAAAVAEAQRVGVASVAETGADPTDEIPG